VLGEHTVRVVVAALAEATASTLAASPAATARDLAVRMPIAPA
jgi:hypothetical protein